MQPVNLLSSYLVTSTSSVRTLPTTCPNDDLKREGYKIQQYTKTEQKNLQTPVTQQHMFAASWEIRILGAFKGFPGYCLQLPTVLDSGLGNTIDLDCGVIKELLETCLKNELVKSLGIHDFKNHIDSLDPLVGTNDWKEDMDETMKFAKGLCTHLVAVHCSIIEPFQYDVQESWDNKCLAYFDAARSAGYNYVITMVRDIYPKVWKNNGEDGCAQEEFEKWDPFNLFEQFGRKWFFCACKPGEEERCDSGFSGDYLSKSKSL